jgi:hypothetical protein
MWIAAAIGVGGALLGGNEERKANKKAAQQYEAGVKRVEANTGLKNYSTGGGAAFNQALGLLGVGGQQPQIDPATGQPMLGPDGQPIQTGGQVGFQNYLDSTGYRTQMKSGIDALNSNAAARGMLKSGATLKATQRFGAGLGQQYFNNYIGQLMGTAGMGQQADQTLANVYTGGAAGQAQAAQAGGAAVGSAVGDAANNIAGAIGYYNRPTG